MTEPLISARPRVRIDGETRADINSAVRDCSINLPLSGMAHCELRLINWGGRTDNPDADFVFNDIEPGQELQILMSEDAGEPVFNGDITAIEERYGDGAPQLVLLAEDKLHLLARLRDNRAHEEQSIGDVISSLAQEANLNADADIDTQGTWHQLNESHLAFMMRLAAPYDIAIRLQDGRVRARAEEQDPEPVRLHAQDNVRTIRLIADLNQQPLSVQSRGYDVAADQEVEHDAEQLTPAPAGQTAADKLAELSWGTAENFPQPAPAAQGEAEGWANGWLRRRAKRYVHGEIVTNGTPDLRSGREIELEGVSPRLVGRYQVVDCQHRFDSQGYRTTIKVQRPDLGRSS